MIAALKDRHLWEEEDDHEPRRTAPPLEPRIVRAEKFAAARPRPPLGEPFRVYEYRGADNVLVAEKARFHEPNPEGSKPRKTFLWRPPHRTTWGNLDGLPMSALPAYGAHKVAAADPSVAVYLCEGESSADACTEHGLLAISFAGGASQTDFGEGLAILAGREVVLWPDNDERGRELMARLQGQLAGRVKSLRVARPPVEARGDDAVDYFARGGTVEALEAGLPPTIPTTEFLPGETIRVRVPIPDGALSFTFEGLERAHRELGAELSVVREGRDGTGGLPYTIRINLRSASAQEGLQRQLGQLHQDIKEKGFWVSQVNTAIARASHAWAGQDETRWFTDMPEAPKVQWLFDGIVPRFEPSVWFGDGECVSGDTLVQGPDGEDRIDVLAARGLPIRVWALGPNGPVATWASAPFLKAQGEMYEFTLSSGKRIRVAERHRFLTPRGWRYVSELLSRDYVQLAVSGPFLPATNSVRAPSVLCEDAPRCFQTDVSYLDRCCLSLRQCDRQLRQGADSALTPVPSLGGVHAHSGFDQHRGDLVYTLEHSPAYRTAGLQSTSGCALVARRQEADLCCFGSSLSIRHSENNRDQQPSPQAIALRQPIDESAQSARGVGVGHHEISQRHSLGLMVSPVYETVVAIRKCGVEPYYDMVVPAYANYLANGIWNHNTGKSVLLQALGTHMALGERFLGRKIALGPVLFIDYENSEDTFRRRVGHIARGIGWTPDFDLPFARVPGRGIPLAEQVEVLRARVLKDHFQLLIVDSAQAACGGKAHDNEEAMRYFQALQRIAPGITTITIAHITKQDVSAEKDKRDSRQPDFPYGGQVWRNQVRCLWYLAPPPPDARVYLPSHRKQVVLYNKKMNDGPRVRPLAVEIDFAGEGEATTFRELNLLGITSAPEDGRHTSEASQQIWDLLQDGPRTQYQIVMATGLKEASVEAILSRNKARFRQVTAHELGYPGANVEYWALSETV